MTGRSKADVAPNGAAPVAQLFRMRLSAGIHAIAAAEAEVRVDGARIAGGNGCFEFNLWTETWIEVVVIRP